MPAVFDKKATEIENMRKEHAAENEEHYKVLSLARSLRVINRNQLVRLLPLQRLGYVVLFHEQFLREQISHQCFY